MVIRTKQVRHIRKRRIILHLAGNITNNYKQSRNSKQSSDSKRISKQDIIHNIDYESDDQDEVSLLIHYLYKKE